MKSLQGKALRCLGPNEVEEVMNEIHSGDCGSHLGGRKLFEQLISMGYFGRQWKVRPWNLSRVVKHVKDWET